MVNFHQRQVIVSSCSSDLLNRGCTLFVENFNTGGAYFQQPMKSKIVQSDINTFLLFLSYRVSSDYLAHSQQSQVTKIMAATEIQPCKVAGLYSLVDLQKLCSSKSLRLSEETSDRVIYTILRRLGPKLAAKAVHKCKKTSTSSDIVVILIILNDFQLASSVSPSE